MADSSDATLLPEEYHVTVRDLTGRVVLFRRVEADSAENAVHVLSYGLSNDSDFGAVPQAEI